jgi:hypothetical protein
MKTSCGDHPSTCRSFHGCPSTTECILAWEDDVATKYQKELLDNLSKENATPEMSDSTDK